MICCSYHDEDINFVRCSNSRKIQIANVPRSGAPFCMRGNGHLLLLMVNRWFFSSTATRHEWIFIQRLFYTASYPSSWKITNHQRQSRVYPIELSVSLDRSIGLLRQSTIIISVSSFPFILLFSFCLLSCTMLELRLLISLLDQRRQMRERLSNSEARVNNL